jgi:menaquinone-9 beta-reductase
MTSIAILGAGPSGTSLALSLIGRGVDPKDLVLLDKARFPRPKLCGGAITYSGTQTLQQLLTPRPPGGLSTASLRFQSDLGAFTLREPGEQWLYDRAALDDALLNRCRDLGVQVREGSKITALSPSHDAWQVKTPTWSERFSWVVGADGANGVSRREAGLPTGTLGRLLEGVFEGDDPCPNVLQFDFSPLTQKIPGYAWVFPHPGGNQRLYKVGIMDGRGVVPGGTLKKWLLDFAHKRQLRPLQTNVPGWPEHYFAPLRLAHRRRFLLTGEALGIDPLLGEGIGPSIALSAYAAKRLKQALDKGRDDCLGYEAGLLATEIGQSLCAQTLLASWLYGPHPRRWLHVLFDGPVRTLAGSGFVTYGKLNRSMPLLGGCLGLGLIKYRGLPENT